jgi:hypothetical protein
MKSIKQYIYEGSNFGVTDGSDMKYTVELDSDGTKYVLSFVKIVSEIQVTLTLISIQYESLQCWYY